MADKCTCFEEINTDICDFCLEEYKKEKSGERKDDDSDS